MMVASGFQMSLIVTDGGYFVNIPEPEVRKEVNSICHTLTQKHTEPTTGSVSDFVTRRTLLPVFAISRIPLHNPIDKSRTETIQLVKQHSRKIRNDLMLALLHRPNNTRRDVLRCYRTVNR